MAHAPKPAPAGPTEDGAEAAVTARVHAALDAIAAAAAAAPRPDGPAGATLRRPLGRIVGLAQVRDIYDQRLSHVHEAEARAATLDPAARSAVARVAARLLGDLTAILEGAGGTASDSFLAMADIAADCDAGTGAALARVARDGGRAADSLMDAAAGLAEAADRRGARVDPAIGPDRIAAVDLGWMTALYTMEEERRSHRTALAMAGVGPGG